MVLLSEAVGAMNCNEAVRSNEDPTPKLLDQAKDTAPTESVVAAPASSKMTPSEGLPSCQVARDKKATDDPAEALRLFVDQKYVCKRHYLCSTLKWY